MPRSTPGTWEHDLPDSAAAPQVHIRPPAFLHCGSNLLDPIQMTILSVEDALSSTLTGSSETVDDPSWRESVHDEDVMDSLSPACMVMPIIPSVVIFFFHQARLTSYCLWDWFMRELLCRTPSAIPNILEFHWSEGLRAFTPVLQRKGELDELADHGIKA